MTLKKYPYFTWIGLGTILLAGGVLRFYGLEKESLWADELESWRISSEALASGVIQLCQTDVHPPGFQLFLWGWLKLAGESPTVLRIPSAIFGLLAVLMMFLLGKRWFSAKEGLIASGLMAVLWFPVYYSQECRAYSLILLLSLLSFYAWREIRLHLRQGNSIPWKWMILYPLIGALGAYTHYFMLTLLFIQALLLGISLVGRWKALGIAVSIYLAMGVLFSPWLPSFFEDLGKSDFWIPEPGWDFYFEFFRRAFFFNQWLSLGVALLLLVGCIPVFRSQESSDSSSQESDPMDHWLPIIWALAPFLIAFIKSKTGTPVLTFQNLILTLPGLYLLAARGFTRFSLPKKLSLWAGGAFCGFALVYLVGIKQYFSKTEKNAIP